MVHSESPTDELSISTSTAMYGKLCASVDQGSLSLTSKVAPSPCRNTGSSIREFVSGQLRLLAMLAWLPLVDAPKDPPTWLLAVAARLLAVAKDATELLLRAQRD